MMIKSFKSLIIPFFLLFTISAIAGQKNDTIFIEGKVLEAGTKLPLNGARVQVDNFSASISNENGTFRLMIPYNLSTMKISCFGYSSVQVPVKGRKWIEISLYKNIFEKPDRIEGAFQNTDAVSMEDELKYRFSSDVRTIKRSGQTGMGSNMFIRGYNSLNMTARPLIIVDGIIWDDLTGAVSIHNGYFINPLLSIDPHDIESVEVIKDATSVYGSKGANGVILIKTVRGRDEATKIMFESSASVVSAPVQIPVMNAMDYRIYATDVLKRAGLTNSQIEKFAFLNDDVSNINYNKYHNDINWYDQVYKSGLNQRYSVSVQGGDEIALYGFSVSYTGSDGVLKGTNMNRLNTMFNSDIKLGKSFQVGTGILFTQTDRELRDDGLMARTSPGFISGIKSPLFHPYKFTTSTGQLTDKLETIDDLGVTNPLSIIEKGMGMHKNYRFIMNIKPEWKINRDLKLYNQSGYSINKMKEHYFIPVNGVSSQNIENRGVSLNVVKDQVMQQISFYNDLHLNFDKVIDLSHEINVSAGYRTIGNKYVSDYGEGHNTGGDYVTNLIASLAFKKIDGLNDKWSSQSIYATAKYVYQKLYTLSASAAMDHSTRFGAASGFDFMGKDWAFFPSVNAEWLVSGQKFMQNIHWIDILKIKAGYGFSGNDDIRNNDRFSYLQSVNYIDKAVGLQLANMNRPEIKWETTRKMNAGIDLSLFKERISIGASVFNFRTYDLLTLKNYTVASGLESYYTNDGELENKGYEINLGVKILNLKKLQWNLQASTAHYKNKLIDLAKSQYLSDLFEAQVLTSVGNPVGLFYGYEAVGVISTSADASELNFKMFQANGSESKFQAGDIQFADLDNNGIIDEKDKKIIGDPNPDFTGAVFNNFAFGDFSLDVVLTYSLGNDVYNYNRRRLESMKDLNNQSNAATGRWIANGQTTALPAAVFGDPMNNSRFSTRWIEDGSYAKIQNIKLMYKLPVQSKLFDGIIVWTSAENVYTFTRYLGNDPESSVSESVYMQGIDAGLLPSARVLNLGLKLNL